MPGLVRMRERIHLGDSQELAELARPAAGTPGAVPKEARNHHHVVSAGPTVGARLVGRTTGRDFPYRVVGSRLSLSSTFKNHRRSIAIEVERRFRHQPPRNSWQPLRRPCVRPAETTLRDATRGPAPLPTAHGIPIRSQIGNRPRRCVRACSRRPFSCRDLCRRSLCSPTPHRLSESRRGRSHPRHWVRPTDRRFPFTPCGLERNGMQYRAARGLSPVAPASQP